MSLRTDWAVAKVLMQMGVIPIDDEPVETRKQKKASPATRRRRQAIRSARKNNRRK